MVVAAAAEMLHANPEVSRGAFDLWAASDWYEIGGGHFGLLYYPSDLFDEVSTVQAAYLTRQLLP